MNKVKLPRSITARLHPLGVLIKEYSTLPLGVLFFALAVLVFYFGQLMAHAHYTMQRFAQDFYANISTELVSIAVTILVIDGLNKRRQTADKKAELIRDLGSKTNDFAQRAARELCARGWHADGTLRGADLIGADLTGVRLCGANLVDAYLNGAHLADADLNGASLTNAQFVGAKLIGTSLYNANLTGSQLYGANLTNAVLVEANLTSAKLEEANLTDTKLEEASLVGAILTRADLTGAKLVDSRYNNATKWPEGFDPKAAGAINIDEEEQDP